VAENATTLTITVQRWGVASSASSVIVASANGTATAGDDFTTVAQALSWGVNDVVAKTFTVTILDDNIFEGTETFTLKLTSPVFDGTGGDVVVSITDYEEGKLQLSSTSFVGQEDSLQLVATVNRVSGSKGAATVKLKSSASAQTPIASNTSDYTDLDTTVSFADGETIKNVAVTLKNDSIAEFSEWFKLTLSNPTGATLGTITNANAEIKDTDIDFTSTLKLLTKTIENVEQSQLIDLAQTSLFDATKKTLDLINAIPILTLTELVAKQDTDGLMTIDVETDRVYLRPVSVKRAPVGAASLINIRDDINSTFTTSQGWYLEAQPALSKAGLTVFQKGLAEIFLPELVISDTGNITIQMDQGAPPFERDASNNVVVNYKFYDRWNLRPSMISSITNATKEGYSVVRHPLDSDEVVVSVVYKDGVKFRQQMLTSAPINGPELIQELKTNGIDRCLVVSGPGCKVAVSDPKQLSAGIVTLDIVNNPPGGPSQTIKVTLFADYKIRKVPSFTASMVGFTEQADLNKDSLGDYKMVYANGEEQYFFLVSSYVTN
jgi:hypothetical protein